LHGAGKNCAHTLYSVIFSSSISAQAFAPLLASIPNQIFHSDIARTLVIAAVF
jgi:hypothetical protein